MTFRKATNMVAVVVFALVLCCVFGTKALAKAGVDFPEWTGIGAKYTHLENRNLKDFVKPTANSISNGAFQSSFDSYLADRVPLREQILLSYSAMQRTCIRIANAPFGFDVYPTYFESPIAFSEERLALFEIPQRTTNQIEYNLQQKAKKLSQIAEANESIRFFVYVVPDTSRLNTSPLMDCISDPLDEDIFSDNYISFLKGITVIDSSVSFDEYIKGWAKSDHHWNIIGAYDGYTRIATALGFQDSIIVAGELLFFEEPAFYGSYARRGRIDELSDFIMDYQFDLGDISISMNGKNKSIQDLAHIDKYIKGQWGKEIFRNRYGEYFHGDLTEIIFSNTNADSNHTLLLVADSYSDCMDRLFSKHYTKVHVIDPRNDNSQSLSDYLSSHPGINDVVLMMNAGDFYTSKFRL